MLTDYNNQSKLLTHKGELHYEDYFSCKSVAAGTMALDDIHGKPEMVAQKNRLIAEPVPDWC